VTFVAGELTGAGASTGGSGITVVVWPGAACGVVEDEPGAASLALAAGVGKESRGRAAGVEICSGCFTSGVGSGFAALPVSGLFSGIAPEGKGAGTSSGGAEGSGALFPSALVVGSLTPAGDGAGGAASALDAKSVAPSFPNEEAGAGGNVSEAARSPEAETIAGSVLVWSDF